MTIDESPCNPWKIISPDHGGEADGINWAPQVTAPLPLEDINDLMSKAMADQDSALLPGPGKRRRRFVWATKDFFQSKPNTISSDSVKDDVLGFFSLILSYTKNARIEQEDDSPKILTSIMPRTEFTTIFALVKSKIPLDPHNLYELIKILACYKNNDDGVGVR